MALCGDLNDLSAHLIAYHPSNLWPVVLRGIDQENSDSSVMSMFFNMTRISTGDIFSGGGIGRLLEGRTVAVLLPSGIELAPAQNICWRHGIVTFA